MTLTQMGPKIEKLIALLEETGQFLRKYDETHWAGWLADCEERLRCGDAEGIERLMGAYGGMGSLNDLMLHPVNRHRLSEADVKAANERLALFRNALYGMAREIQGEGVAKEN